MIRAGVSNAKFEIWRAWFWQRHMGTSLFVLITVGMSAIVRLLEFWQVVAVSPVCVRCESCRLAMSLVTRPQSLCHMQNIKCFMMRQIQTLIRTSIKSPSNHQQDIIFAAYLIFTFYIIKLPVFVHNCRSSSWSASKHQLLSKHQEHFVLKHKSIQQWLDQLPPVHLHHLLLQMWSSGSLTFARPRICWQIVSSIRSRLDSYDRTHRPFPRITANSRKLHV